MSTTGKIVLKIQTYGDETTCYLIANKSQRKKKEIKICIEKKNENENTTTQNQWDSVKAVPRGRFRAIQAYLKKLEKNQINNLTLQLKQLEKEEIKNRRVSRRK